MWRTVPVQVPLCATRAHLFPFPGENQRSAELSGTERSSRGFPPSPASRNSAKGGRAPRSGPAGAGQPGQAGCKVLSGEDQRVGRCCGSARGPPGAHSALRHPGREPTRARPSQAPDSRHHCRDWRQRIPSASTVFSAADVTCFARAMGTVLPSSFKQRLIRSLLRFSITLWETGVLCEQRFVRLGWFCPESRERHGWHSCLPALNAAQGLAPGPCPSTVGHISSAFSHPRWCAPFPASAGPHRRAEHQGSGEVATSLQAWAPP